MRNFLQISEKIALFNKPWLVLGKGPTFEKILEKDYSKYNIFGLNQVARFYPCDITHFIDYDTFDLQVLTRSKAIICPFHGHVNCKVQFKNLYHYIQFSAYFSSAEEHKKLFWYNCSTWKKDHEQPIKPIIKAKYFSSEAAFRILAHLGIKEIHSLGIDGGNTYASTFLDSGLIPLTNGQVTFDKQFAELQEICRKFKLTWKQL